MTLKEIGQLFEKNREVLRRPLSQIGDSLEEIFQIVFQELLSDEYKEHWEGVNKKRVLTTEQREKISELDALLYSVVSEQSYLEWLTKHRIETEDVIFNEYFNKGQYSFYLNGWKEEMSKKSKEKKETQTQG